MRLTKSLKNGSALALVTLATLFPLTWSQDAFAYYHGRGSSFSLSIGAPYYGGGYGYYNPYPAYAAPVYPAYGYAYAPQPVYVAPSPAYVAQPVYAAPNYYYPPGGVSYRARW